MKLWIAYRYDEEDKLTIGMISANQQEVRIFAANNGLKVDHVLDGETFPVI